MKNLKVNNLNFRAKTQAYNPNFDFKIAQKWQKSTF